MSRVYWLEAKFEVLKLVRMKQYALSTLLFPMMFYAFFGLATGWKSPGSLSAAKYLLATYGAFGVVGATLFAFGTGVAVERGLGWLQLKRTSPMPMAAYFAAKAAASACFGAAVVVLLFSMGALLGDVRMPAAQWLTLGGALIAGAIPFCALGLAIGNLVGPNSAPGIVNLIYLPLGFLAGLWIPIDFLPKGIQAVAPYLPTYHFAQIALSILHARSAKGSVAVHVLALAGFTVLFAVIAWLGQRRENEKMYG